MQNADVNHVITPAYVFSEDQLLQRISMIRRRLGAPVRLVYAMKANPFLVSCLNGFVDAFEVCSPGEESICRRAGIEGKKLVLSGVNKEPESTRSQILMYREKAVYTVESIRQAELLNRLAMECGTALKVLLRLSSGNQFGMDVSAIRSLLLAKETYPALRWCGLQFYSGTQKSWKKIEKELGRLDELLCSLKAEFSSSYDDPSFLSELEYGPGLPVFYFVSDPEPEDEQTLDRLRSCLDKLSFSGTVTLEMGRFIAAYCGCYLTKVMDTKITEDCRYCITDGGIHQLNYYGQMMAMKVPHVRIIPAGSDDPFLTGEIGTGSDDPFRIGAMPPKTDDPSQSGTFPPGSDDPVRYDLRESSRSFYNSENAAAGLEEPAGRASQQTAGRPADRHWTICGSLCTTADVLIRDFSCSCLYPGDILIFERTGAYSVTEGISLFLSRDLPRVYLKRHENLILLRDQIQTEEWNYGRTSQLTGGNQTGSRF